MWLPWAMLRFSSVLKNMIFSGYSTATTSQISHKIMLFNLYSLPSSLILICCTSQTHLCVCEFHLFRIYSYFPHTNTMFKNHLKRRANQRWQILSKYVSQQEPFQQKNSVNTKGRSTEKRNQTNDKFNGLTCSDTI